MRHLIVLELKKFILQNHHVVILLLFCFLLGFDLHTKVNQQIPIAQTIDQQITAQSYNLRSSFSEIRGKISEYPDNPIFVDMLDWVQEDLDYNMAMSLAVIKQDWPAYLETRIASDTLRLTHLEETKSLPIWYETEAELIDNIELNTILLEQNIIPMDTTNNMEGYNALVLIMGGSFIYVIFALCVYFTSSILPSEFETGTYKLLLTQPISKTKLLLSKIIAALMINYTWVTLIIGSCFWYATSKCGLGEANYPIKLLINGTQSYTNIKNFVLLTLLLLFLIITLLTLLTLCLSVLTKHSILTLFISGGMIVLFGCLPLTGIFTFLSHLNPFSYLMIVQSLTGTTAKLLNNSQLDLNHGIIGLTLLCILLMGTSILSFKKQKISS